MGFVNIFRYYLLNLEKSDKHNMCVFRMISLWLENRNNAGVLKLIEKYLDSIPTYKFISILPQLIPHITSREDDVFGKHITQVVKRCAQVINLRYLLLLYTLSSKKTAHLKH